MESICDLLQPTLMARIIDIGVASGDLGVVARGGLLMVAVAALGAAGAAGRNIIASLVSFRFAADLRQDLFRRITSFSFAELDAFETASLVTRQTNDVSQVQAFVNGVMRIFAKAPILAGGSLVMAVLLEPRLAVILAVVVPVAALLIAASLAVGYPRFRRVQTALDGVNSVSREYLGGVRVVKAFGQEEREVRRFARANGELTTANIRALRALALFGPGIALTVNLGIVAVLWFGGLEVAGGGLPVGKTIAFINYMTQLLFALGLLSWIFTFFVRAKASWERVREVLEKPATERLEVDGRPAPPRAATPAVEGVPGVGFRGVSFAYPGGPRVLEGVNLACETGKLTAVIGPTGAGKSTLVSLVPRFYDLEEGLITMGGRDIREMDLRELRRRIALVPQRTVLFTGTIAANLRWGKEDATDEELEVCARRAAAHEFIATFPEGYGSVVGQGGVNLSGGQKQRLAIARAFLRHPEVLILDDCTSSVDSITESEILNQIRETAAGLTCILITQRISAAAAADRLLVLDDGTPAGVGTHRALIGSCEVYRDIAVAQLGREAVDGVVARPRGRPGARGRAAGRVSAARRPGSPTRCAPATRCVCSGACGCTSAASAASWRSSSSWFS